VPVAPSLTGAPAVLTRTQLHQLGSALQKIHQRFSAAYGPGSGSTGWYAMDIEFKFDDEADPGQPPAVRQTKPGRIRIPGAASGSVPVRASPACGTAG
jgi:hypothetical protein